MTDGIAMTTKFKHLTLLLEHHDPVFSQYLKVRFGEERVGKIRTGALWSGTNRNRDVSTGPLARPFARSLAPLTRGKVNS